MKDICSLGTVEKVLQFVCFNRTEVDQAWFYQSNRRRFQVLAAVKQTVLVVALTLLSNVQRVEKWRDSFVQCFDDENDPFHDTVASLVNKRSEDNKSPLDWAALVGNVTMLLELIKRGADINAVSERGMLRCVIMVFISAWYFVRS